MIAVVGIDITITAVTPIVTGLTGAIHSANAGSSMTVSPPRRHAPAAAGWREASAAIRRRSGGARRPSGGGLSKLAAAVAATGGTGLSAQTTKEAAVPMMTLTTRLTAVLNAACGWSNDISMTRHAVTAPISQA